MQRMLLLITLWVCPALVAQHYPSKPVSMIVAFSPGAATDLMGRIPPVMAAHPSLPVSNARGLIALARQRTGQLFFLSSGTGTALRLAGELFKWMSNIDITHIPNKGASLGVIDLVGGQVQLAWVSLPTVLPDYELPNWVGLFAPAQTPMEIVMRLNAEISRWPGQPETQKMAAQGVEREAGSPANFGDRVARGHALMGGIIKRSGIQLA